MSRVYKIMSQDEWTVAEGAGVFAGSALDLKDGYIHLSSAEQAPETARLHFRHQPGLVLLTCDAEALGDELRWEPSRGGQLFPHLHAPLPVSAVRAVTPMPLDDEGVPQVGPLAT